MAVIVVRVTPRAARNSVDGHDEAGALRVRVTAAPADGAANVATTRLLAEWLGLPVRDVVLTSGASSRIKRFSVPVSDDDLRARLRTLA